MNSRKENRKWHWVFWSIYFIINHAIFSPSLWSPVSLGVQLIFVLHNAGTAYTTLDYWVPRFYQKRKYGRFFLATMATILTFTALHTASLRAFILHFGQDVIDVDFFFSQYMISAFMSNISGMAFLLAPYFILQRVEMERRNRQLEKEKLAAELKFLKSQLHPHFLFNALNNIYFLIKKDPDTAAEALAGFSNLLRFQLYEANNAEVPLTKEIEYLQQFAEIAQLRKGDNFKVNWQLPEKTDGIEIAPLLFMPLIENAFKHGSNKDGTIDIQLTIEKETLQFCIVNSKEADKSLGLQGFEEGGIGLVNIRKRLDLLYPNRHNLVTKELDNEFMVELKLVL